ncbi:hypothetical protein V6N13_030595 [Hibiscus sabdariffa]
MVGRRARKSMSGAADDSTTKFPISGKVPLEWLMHRLASPSPGHANNVTPNTGSPFVATVQLGGVSRPSNVRASAKSMSQWVLLLRQPALPFPPFVALDFLFAAPPPKLPTPLKKPAAVAPPPSTPTKILKLPTPLKKQQQ